MGKRTSHTNGSIKIWAAIPFIFLFVFFQNCQSPVGIKLTQASLSSVTTSQVPAPPLPSPTPPCTLTTVTKPLRILFMVDNSGSTTTTDPNYADRVKTVAAFLATYGSNTNFTYSYSYFGSSVQTFDFASGNFSATPTEVFANGSQAPSALNTFVTEVPGTDAGGNTTNYLPALWALTAMVLEDANTNPGQQYVAVFMSDGQPGDITGGVAQLASLVTNFVTVVRGANITLSSVYFGPETDTTSIANLTTMASSGGGVFVDTNKTTNLSIDSLITLLPSACE